MNLPSSLPLKLLLVLFCGLSSSSLADESRSLNVVILYIDDLRHDSLSCAGNPVVKTPNIDALARDGIRFTHNCVTTSICGVSRATLLTGQWMSRHGNKGFDAFATPWSETYPGILRDHGYYVGHVGKWHNGAFPEKHFDYGRSYAGKHWLKQPDGSSIHVTKQNQSDALEFLQGRPIDKPFCLTLAFFAPHAEDQNPEQYLPQPDSMSLYQDVSIPIPRTATDEAFRRLPPFIANEKNESRNRWHWRFDTPDRYQKYMKNYYRLVTEVDAVCGQVVDELRKQGVLEQTLVICTSDNGYFHAEHGLADKWYPHEESIRVPLIICDPRLPTNRRGLTNGDLSLNADLAPTILAATNLPAPQTMQGCDLSPLYLAAEKPVWRDEFFYEHATVRSTDFIPASEALVRQDWKYFYWPDFQYEQLFQLSEDPLEDHDLARDPQYAEKLAEMRARFRELKLAAS